MSDERNIAAAMRGGHRSTATARGVDQGRPVDSGSSPLRCQRVVVLGEFNSGKTTLVNALVGAPVLHPSAITHTLHPTVVAFRTKPSLSAETVDRKRTLVTWDDFDAAPRTDVRRLHVGAPLARLQHLAVVDTPGFGLDDWESERASLRACRNADTVIWCTPAMQAWKASEERTWLALPQRVRAGGILAVTFADAIASQADVERLLQRLTAEAGPYFQKIVLAEQCAALVAARA